MTVKKKPQRPCAACADRLEKMAHNLWWTWNPEAQEIFHELAPLAWERSNHNPLVVLREVSSQELRARLADEDFRKKVEKQLHLFDEYLAESTTWASKNAKKLKGPIAYFSAEFGLHESIPIYSGGLGILSGDHAKSASDLGLPFIGISLFYRQGYFVQHLSPDGWQQETNPQFDPERLPLTLVTNSKGERIICTLQIGHATVYYQAWRLDVGRACVYLLDTNLPENDLHFQRLTAQVYGGDIDTRIQQEIMLGIGGVHLLRALGIQPAVYHMNEGHSAFLTLELLREQLAEGVEKTQAIKNVRKHCIFTTHTPVPAGHDRFSPQLMADTFGIYWSQTGLTTDELLELGRVQPDNRNESFTMTVLALKMSHAANGVSQLHGEVSRDMWKELYPGTPADKVPIGHITNGIHTPSWASREAHTFWDKLIGPEWTAELMKPAFWKNVESKDFVSNEELWGFRYRLRRQLVEYVRHQLREQHIRSGEDGMGSYEHILSPDALTICFARRFATYKRAPLIFRKMEKIIPVLNNPERPVQIIFAGKAHPRDIEGKKFLKQIHEISKMPQLFGKVVFIENYDINVGRQLVAGADIWLNNPRRPLEASGTSGMKVVIHGGLNCSIMDGWWREGFNGRNGWKIGTDDNDPNPDVQDDQDFNFLFQVLTEEIIPEFYTRDANGIPTAWLKRIRNSMRSLIPIYNTDLMVAEYTTKYYMK